MLTPNDVATSTVVDFVRLAWRHSLHWETPEITDVALLGQIMDADGFGAVTTDAACKLLPVLSGIAIGRAYSALLYAMVPMWEGHKTMNLGNDERPNLITGDGSPDVLLTGHQRVEIADAFIAAMKRCGADELSVLGHQTKTMEVPVIGEPVDYWWTGAHPPLVVPYRIRAWWD